MLAGSQEKKKEGNSDDEIAPFHGTISVAAAKLSW
jgi:hypothetical protein